MTEIKEERLIERELEERVRDLEERNKQLEDTILEYQYQLGEKERPLPETTLREYLDGMNDSKKIKDYKSKKYIVTEARIEDYGFKRELFWMIGGLYIDLIDSEGRKTRFKKFDYKKSKKEIEEILNKAQNASDVKFEVHSYPKGGLFPGNYYFVNNVFIEGKKINL